MAISDETKNWIRENLAWNSANGDLFRIESRGNCVTRSIDGVTGELLLTVMLVPDGSGFIELPAASVCWFIKTGEWPEFGVKLKDRSGDHRELLRWSNLKKIGKREAEARANRVVSADLLRRVLVVLSERWEIGLMKEIEEVLRG